MEGNNASQGKGVLLLKIVFVWICCADALSSSRPKQQVKVTIQRQLPTMATPEEARKQFLDYVWEKGGGLPIAIRPITTRKKKFKSDGLQLATTLKRRQILPILMEEELLESTPTTESSILCQLQYQVKNGGLLSSEIVPDSHLGTVTFASSPPSPPPSSSSTADDTHTNSQQHHGVTMTWDVVFDTTEASRTFLWQFVTDQTITDSCNNFQAAMAVPRLYKRTTLFISPPALNKLTPDAVMEQWLQFCWKEGGGLPLPLPPIQLGNDGASRWIVPPFLKERILSTTTITPTNGCAEIQYQVDNPGMFTYQAHSHHGRIRFSPTTTTTGNHDASNSNNNSNDGVRMEWEIEIRPYHGWSTLLEGFTGAIVSCYARNFQCHLQEGSDAKVGLKLPRGGGGADSDSDGDALLYVRKESWVGGVLDAHRKDRRDTIDQIIALFQPWTWGRSAESDGEGEGESWSDGYMSD